MGLEAFPALKGILKKKGYLDPRCGRRNRQELRDRSGTEGTWLQVENNLNDAFLELALDGDCRTFIVA